MIFVVDAIGRRMCSRFDHSTSPVAASMRIAAGASIFGTFASVAPPAPLLATSAARPAPTTHRKFTANECSVGP